MKSSFIHHVSIIRFGALALLALCFVQPQVRAQREVSSVFHWVPSSILLIMSREMRIGAVCAGVGD